MSQFNSSWSITRLTATKLPTRAKLAASRRTGNQSKAWRSCPARSITRVLTVFTGQGQQAISQRATGPSRKYQKITAKKLW
jgi:hypothetical protein